MGAGGSGEHFLCMRKSWSSKARQGGAVRTLQAAEAWVGLAEPEGGRKGGSGGNEEKMEGWR